jgi:histidine triad (HIT) family protein
MASIFSRIIKGEIPAHKIAEDDDYLAFLDISPLAKGHTLVIPKIEVDYIFSLDDNTYQGLWLFAKKISGAIKAAVPCERIGIAVIGLEVPHTHIHLVPINNVSDINFQREKLKPSNEELSSVAEDIRSFLGS